MKTLALDLVSVTIRPLCDIASLGELASGVPLRPWITFYMLGPSELDIASWRRFFQLSVLASFIASVASRQASIHSWRFWWIVWRRRLRLRILARTCGVIQGLDLRLGLDFPTWVVAVLTVVTVLTSYSTAGAFSDLLFCRIPLVLYFVKCMEVYNDITWLIGKLSAFLFCDALLPKLKKVKDFRGNFF